MRLGSGMVGRAVGLAGQIPDLRLRAGNRVRDHLVGCCSGATAYLATEGAFTISAVTVLEVVKRLHKARRDRELDRHMTDAAGAALDQHALPGLDLGPVDQP